MGTQAAFRLRVRLTSELPQVPTDLQWFCHVPPQSSIQALSGVASACGHSPGV